MVDLQRKVLRKHSPTYSLTFHLCWSYTGTAGYLMRLCDL